MIFLLSVLLYTDTVLAQYPTDEKAPEKAAVKSKKIKLSDNPGFSDNKPAFKIAAIEVVNLAWDTAHLGYLQVGMGNRKAAAVPDGAAATWLQDFVNKAYGNLYTPEGARLLWIVEDLRIGERTGGMSEKAFIRLKATAYASTDGTAYRQVTSFDDVRMVGGLDVTHKHKTNIANAFQHLFDTTLAKAPQSSGSTLSYDAIIAKHQQRYQAPALKDTTLNNGVYLTFKEFLDNKPSYRLFELKKGKRNFSVSVNGADGLLTEKEAFWGVVKDGEIYAHVAGNFIPLERTANGFVISNYIEASKQRNNQMLLAGVAGGAIGGAIAGAMAGTATSSGPRGNSTVKIYYTDAFPQLDQRPEATAIDIETGELIF